MQADGSPPEAPEEDVEFLTLSSPTKGVTLRLSAPFTDLPGGQPGNLLAVSNVFGWAVAGTMEGFALFSMATLRSTFANSPPHQAAPVEATPTLIVPSPARVDFVRFAFGDKLVIVGTRDGSVGVWKLKSLVEGNTAPAYGFPPAAPGPIIDILPNPAPSSPLLAILAAGSLTVYDLSTFTPHSTFPPSLSPTSACWSVRGKQIAVGTANGSIGQFTPEGEVKAEIGLPVFPPESAGGVWEVRSLWWLENNVFMATYARPKSAEPSHEYEVYTITKGDAGNEYLRFFDPTPGFGMMTREGRRWLVRFKGWAPFKHLLFMANAPSSDIGAIGQMDATSQWACLALPEPSRPSVPLTATSEDTAPIGFELDLCSDEPSTVGAGDEKAAGPPSPALMVYTSEGALAVWKVVNEKGRGYDGVKPAADIKVNEDAAEQREKEGGAKFGAAPVFGQSASPTSAAASTTTPSTGGFAGFGQAAGAKPASGFGSFASGSTGSSFGSSTPSAFGSNPAVSTTSAFGTPASTTTTSAFSTTGTAKFSPFSAGATKSSTAGRMGNDSDSEPEEDMGDDAGGRVDEPPDLEPTVSGLDIGESMKTAKSSVAISKATPSIASSFGGLGFGATPAPAPTSPFGSKAEETAKAASIFGSPTPVTVKTPPAAGATFGFGSGLKPATGFGFGAPATSTPPATETKEAPKPAGAFASFSASSSPFGAAASTPLATETKEAPKPAGPFASFSSSSTPFGVASAASPKAEAPKPAFSFGTPAVAPPATPSPAPAAPPPASTPISTTAPPKPSVELSPSSPVTPDAAKPSTPAPATPPPQSTTPATTPAAAPPKISTPPAEPVQVSTTPASAPKSLFGFASSPPAPSSPVSLLSRLSEAKAPDDDEEAPASTPPVAKPTPAPAVSNGFAGFGKGPSMFGASAMSSAPKTSSPLAGPSLGPSAAAPRVGPSQFAAPSPSPLSFGSTAPPKEPAPAPTPIAPAAAPSKAPAPAATPAFSFAPQSTAAPKAAAAPAPFSFSSAPAPAPASAAASSASGQPKGFAFSQAPSFTAPVPSPTPPPQGQKVPAPAPTTPQVQVRTGPSLGTTSTPKLGTQLSSTSSPSVKESGMAGEFLKAFLLLQSEFELLRTNTKVCKSFVKDIAQPFQLPDQPPSYNDTTWSMGDLKHLGTLTEKVKPGVSSLVGAALVQKRQAAELSSQMLKAETKREEAARFIRARDDPVFAKMVRVRQLGPEQIENQKKIRLSVEAVRSRVTQVEEHMVSLKDKVMEERLGRSSFRTPSLDAVNRAVRNITVAVTEKTFELDDLAIRLDMLRVGPNSPAATPKSRQRALSIEDPFTSSPLRGSTKSTPQTFHPNVVATAKAALSAERSVSVLKKALLAVRPAPLLNTTAVEGVNITGITHYAKGDPVILGGNGGPIDATSTTSFCRVEMWVTTNTTTGNGGNSELWLPDEWNSRLVAMGNGGFSGGVVYPSLFYDGVERGFAGFSTDTGHNSTSVDGSWALGNPEAIIDFGWRAMHVGFLAAKNLTEHTGGRQGVKEMSRFPDDFDGVVIGSPANRMAGLIPWEVRQDLAITPVNSTRWIPVDLWTVIHVEALKQCDGVDGVLDGVIDDPRACTFRPQTLTCRPGQNASTCLTLDQIATLETLYTDYYNGDEYIFASYEVGGELLYPNSGFLSAKPWGFATGYYPNFVLNTTWDYTTLNFSTIQKGFDLNSGDMDTVDGNLLPFFNKGGKVMHYVGWSDEIIAPGNSIRYYDEVTAYTTANSELDIDDSYKLYTVPGMGHCGLGAGPNAFGGVNQRYYDMPPGVEGSPKYDILLAMVEWVENGTVPDYLIGTSYVDNNATLGTQYTRKLCPYPQKGVFQGGDNSTYTSFECK
ncbi:feruloyl esterase-like protein [Pseudohyphozyma bogoriensis]|nr:feruloyl esterase-like protein [Pseudohyphozyma bogoriensis]